jgi:AcrR family transcriptional regulator
MRQPPRELRRTVRDVAFTGGSGTTGIGLGCRAVRTPPTNGRLDTSAPDTRRESTERRILESAVELIGDGVAWHQLGIRQIAERAEISRTAFYDFFGSKNEVLEQLISGLHQDLAQALVEQTPGAAQAAALGPALLDLVQLRAVLSTIADYNAQHGAVYRAFLDATGEDPRLHELWDDLMGLYAELVIQAIDHARAARPSAPAAPDSAALAQVLLMTTERTMYLLRRQSADEPDRRTAMLEALAQVWERSVFGGPLPAG